ncbi:hypothetical protein C8R43DRAFT_956071 [Mycena crocata]|nr:hypothetical protein C8R43DRAFT_956071 [Mycena crocata]
MFFLSFFFGCFWFLSFLASLLQSMLLHSFLFFSNSPDKILLHRSLMIQELDIEAHVTTLLFNFSPSQNNISGSFLLSDFFYIPHTNCSTNADHIFMEQGTDGVAVTHTLLFNVDPATVFDILLYCAYYSCLHI